MSTPTSRTPFIVAGIVTAVLSLGFFAAGAAALWANGEKDSDGYFSTSTETFSARTAALTSDNIDLDIGAGGIIDAGDLGKLRLQAESHTGKPLFVGIARTENAENYLRGVAHTTLTDVDVDPFKAGYRDHPGARRATRPADEPIWAASSTGRGQQTVTWDIDDGDWSVVVMNADGSPGVSADVRAGANAPFLTAAGWTALGGGVLLLAITASLFAVGARPQLARQGTAPLPA